MKRDKLMARLAWLWAIAVGAALAPQMARAVDGSETVTGGGIIEFTGAAEVSRVGADELLLKFTDTETPGTVKLPGLTQMRVLAVGGGGGGGGANKNGFQNDYGSGSGGGGGGFLEITNQYDVGLMTISVGKGGDAGKIGTLASSWVAQNGDPSIVSFDGAEIVHAYGGGGGNGHNKGRDGASGGGGSQDASGNTYDGGGVLLEAAGQGFPGGAGNQALYGGGGGGAGAPGADASTKNPVGGDGRQSDITGLSEYYGGGGGGSYGYRNESSTGKTIAGGQGGGGKGGYGTKGLCTAGENGFGGGGGGCRAATSGGGGKGGSGVVYIRVSAAISGSLEKPTDKIVTYDGEKHVVVPEIPFYTVVGDGDGTELGAYYAKVKPKDGFKWTDGTDDEVTVMLAIVNESSLTGSETVAGGGTITYAGASEVKWIDNLDTGSKDLLLIFTNAEEIGSFKLPGKTRARILAIGGGGGGGGANKNGFTGKYGSGGGGGAGGMLEITNMFSSAVYAVNVGTGGVAGTIGTVAAKMIGGNGGNTTIRMNGSDWITAYGGGGGGGHSLGCNGASGGGGSQNSAGTTFAGGSVLLEAAGQGFPGGAGDLALYGGGGGGAGAPGADASTTNPVGGDGRPSDITGPSEYYAGGGGGSYGYRNESSTGKTIAGGLGGGGKGGYGTKGLCTAGENGRGGGGGGCRANTSGSAGKGGSGGVYVRISMSFEGDIPKPEAEQTYVYDGNAHTSVVESLAYEIDGPVVGTDVGDYEATVTLMEGLDWRGGGEREQKVVMHVTKAKVTISDLVQKDWMFGTPAAAVPKPMFSVNLPDVTTSVTYGDSAEGPFSVAPSTEIGTHWVKVSVEGTSNYDGDSKVVPFRITEGLGDVFKDYVEITVDGYAGTDPSELTNYPYRVVLSERVPNGFLYSRVGDDGNRMTFTDLDNVVLPYQVKTWDPEGESVLYVKIPLIGSEPQTIRLYWSVRPGAAVPDHAPDTVWSDWSDEAYAKVTNPPGSGFDFVLRDGYKVNSWKAGHEPKMSKSTWDEHDPEPGRIEVEGELMYGGRPAPRFVNAFDESVVYETMPTAGGAYRVVWEYRDPKGEFEYFRDSLDFTIFGHNPIDVFGDSVQATLSGRVMLVNDDIAEGHGVDYQSYWHVRETDGKLNDIFWEHTGVHDCWDSYIHNIPGTSHALYHIADDGATTNLLWRFENVLIGNTFKKGSPLSNHSGKCFLPWSSTACSFSAPGKDPGLMEESCNIVMRNMVGAAVYSPVYSNGVGTIYFDAVNANLQNVLDGVYRLRVDIAVADSAEELKDIAEDQWQTISMLPLKRDETDYFMPCPETEHLTLDITHDKSTNNFYRVCAKVDRRGPVCFRIVRESCNPQYAEDLDLFILLDNIIVSYPKNTAEMKPFGFYDKKKKGKQILGQAAATTVPFPATGEQLVYGRGWVDPFTNPLNDVDPSTFVTYAKMFYRWRYLDQQTNAWNSVELWPGDGFRARRQLNLPLDEGDVEFFYEIHTQVPYYRYYDYSGLGVGIDASLYTEEELVRTNVMSVAEREDKILPSCGTNWFFRLRRGRSDVETYRIWVDDGKGAQPHDMELIGDRTWRGYFPTPKEVEDGLKVRFEVLNGQVAGSEVYSCSTNYFRLRGTDEIVPWATSSLQPASGPDDWSTVACDGSTGYLMFQVEEQTHGVSVVHADYQNFNRWSDANRTEDGGRFVGTSTDTNSMEMAGTGLTTSDFREYMYRWHQSVATNVYWTERFAVDQSEMGPGKAWETYRPFEAGATNTPNGFSVGAGQWVTGNYRDTRTGMAYQMAGKGNGYMQIIRPAGSAPRGIESVEFKARLGQGIGFDDIAYYNAGERSADMTNYTFLTRAAFDLAGRTQFSGNASLSVVAGHLADEGCYEFRVEQQNAKFETATSSKVSGADNVFRISLYRWRYDSAAEDYVATELGHKDDISGNDILNTSGEEGKFTTLFISLDVRAGETRVAAGMTGSTSSVGNYNAQTSFAHSLWVSDTDAARLTYGGTYGVLAANCPARFVQPVTYPKANISGTWPATATYKALTVSHQTESSCREAIDKKGGWVIPQWRMTKYMNGGAGKSAYYGLDATVTGLPLEVYTAPIGTDQWKLLFSTNVVDYGRAGDGGDIHVDIYSREDCNVRIASGKSGKSERNGIVIDDVVIRQWRGESYDDAEGRTYFPSWGDGSPTNFVFTQCWIGTNGIWRAACELNAKRSLADVPTGIRSPLMDGAEDLDGNKIRGLGLGMFTFSYRKAHENVNLLLQIATNRIDATTLPQVSRSLSERDWTTVTNFSFAGATDLESGKRSFYLGLHGVTGAMRIVMDPKVVAAVEDETDPEKFGSILITDLLCRDEPALDERSWWGWNLRTTDDPAMMNLVDVEAGLDAVGNGLALGLNNSVTEDVLEEDIEQYPKHLPFLQTPRFRSSFAGVGAVSFRARLYSADDPVARITLFGAHSGETDDESQWKKLTSWDVTDALYRDCSYKTAPGDNYTAFRFAVTGVPDVTNPMRDPRPLDPPRRVLLDEVLVMEAVRPQVSFRNVAAFRNRLDRREPVMNALDDAEPGLRRSEQPLCRESWGVQAEIFVSQLADEVDLSNAKVRLWWYENVKPWGFSSWRDRPDAKCAWLAPCIGTNGFYRSNYFDAPDAVMPPQQYARTVQYTLEVIYKSSGAPATNWLTEAEWVKPEWYEPLDYNATLGPQDGGFSAYTILDTVSPGWAWINEVNVFGYYYDGWNNSDKPLQFVEVAAPHDADLTGWSIRFLDAQIGDRTVTNTVARFGSGTLAGLKTKNVDEESKCVFHVVGAPSAKGSLHPDAGELDGTWSVGSTESKAITSDGEIHWYHPVSIELVRPSGIVEHSVTAIGTNYYPTTESRMPSKHVEWLNAHGGRFIDIGADDAGSAGGTIYEWSRSLGVSGNNGVTPMNWNNWRTMTPGRRNEGQVIDPNYPKPNGTAAIIYSSISGPHLTQSFAGADHTNSMVILVWKKGAETGTNIVYHADKWFEVGKVTVNGSAVGVTPLGNRTYSVEVGKNVSNDLDVVASARVSATLQNEYQLDANNRYRDAVVDWLWRGRTKRGEFAHPERETIGLARFETWHGHFVTNLTLTTMYWLDMDPTLDQDDLVLRAGFTKFEPDVPVERAPGDVLHNRRIGVGMMISNTVDDTAWAPYILQGREPGKSSWDYLQPGARWAWTNATFKITGILVNSEDKTSLSFRDRWLPLRWFVFGGEMVGDKPRSTSFDENFQAEVDIVDPFSLESPGVLVNWWKYKGVYPVWNSWDIDDRLQPQTVELLKPHNRLDGTTP